MSHIKWHVINRIVFFAQLVCCLFVLFQTAQAADTPVIQDKKLSGNAIVANGNGVSATQPDSAAKRLDSGLFASRGNMAVFYPNVSEPYRSIFTKIIEGIEDRTKGKVRSYAIDNDKLDVSELNTQLKRNDTRVVIALGRVGVKAAAILDHDISIIAGGILTVNENDQQNMTGISFNPDPALLFARLKVILPEVRKVLVVYNPQQNESLLKLAREAAKAQGLELQAFEARDLATAARTYEALFSTNDKQHVALWLPNDPVSTEESTVMPLVLRESWNNGLPIFSSSLAHVKRGALFALYPNNLELGRNLASSALGVMAGETRKKGMQPLREVHLAVNLRTASHIGLHIEPQQQRTFDFVFPEP